MAEASRPTPIEGEADATAAYAPTRPIASAMEIVVSVGVIAWIAWSLRSGAGDGLDWSQVAFFILVITAVDLIPVPVWGGMQLSLSFPLLVSVALLYDPAIAGLIALLGSVDPRELKAEVRFQLAIWNRSQLAFAMILASGAFYAICPEGSAEWTLRYVLGVAAAALVVYVVNAVLVGLNLSLSRGIPFRTVLGKMAGRRPLEFILPYFSLGLFGAVIAQFYLREGALSVVIFLAPLAFARQMYFRSRVLAEQLADRNELLAQQADRLEDLLQKEHDTVDELRELNRMKGEFVAVVSHELRTPLTALIGYAKTLRQPVFAEDPEMREEFLERMERQGDRLLALVENLLTAAKLENDQLQVSVGRLLFEDLANDVVEGLANDADRIVLSVPEDLPIIHTDRQLLVRVVSNLMDNALKYSPDGTPCDLGARAEGEGIVFWIADRGIGIEPELLERIFDQFYQVDSSSTRSFPGAGLGLSMVRDLLTKLGGTVDVASVAGQGSTFTVHLPAWAPVDAAGQPEAVTGTG
jgi:signal transduction histidine kinase